jgi:hypothetical protein
MPIATVYPPGALIVELHALSVNATYNVSTFHANDYLYDTNPNALSDIWCVDSDTFGPLKAFVQDQPEHSISSLLETCVSKW